MSVILTDMDIPETCYKCRYSNANEMGTRCEKLHRMISYGRYNRLKHRLDDCPMKSIEGLIERIECLGADEKKAFCKNLNPSYVQGLKDALKVIKEYCEVE